MSRLQYVMAQKTVEEIPFVLEKILYTHCNSEERVNQLIALTNLIASRMSHDILQSR